jgi:hypothetical protein
MITPASDAVFRASGETSPNGKGWVEARTQALVLAEAGNLLMLGSRARDTGVDEDVPRSGMRRQPAASAAESETVLAGAVILLLRLRGVSPCATWPADGYRQVSGASRLAANPDGDLFPLPVRNTIARSLKAL